MAAYLSLLSPDEIKVTRKLNVGPAVDLGLNANQITITRSHHLVIVPPGSTAERSLRTINGGEPGDLLILRLHPNPEFIGASLIIDDAAGNINSDGNFSLTSTKDTIMFLFDGAAWVELSRSNNS